MSDFGEYAGFDPPWEEVRGDLAGPDTSGDVTGIPGAVTDFGAFEGAQLSGSIPAGDEEGGEPGGSTGEAAGSNTAVKAARGFYEGGVWAASPDAKYGVNSGGLYVYRKPKAGDEPPRAIGEAGHANLSSTLRMVGAAVGAIATISLVKHGVDSGWFTEQARFFAEEFRRWVNSPAGQ